MVQNKFDFMRDMLIRARNRHRRELGPEQPEAGQSTPEQSSSAAEPAEGYDGSTGKRPLKVNVDTIGFKGLIKLACEFNVPHDDYSRWSDDEWPDKEDELRVAIAEAMEKIGD